MLGPDRGFCSTKLPFWKVKFGLASAFFFSNLHVDSHVDIKRSLALGRIAPKLRKHVQRKTLTREFHQFVAKKPILRVSKSCYCWWKKSCTTQHKWNLVNNGIFTISTGAGFLPSTVYQAPLAIPVTSSIDEVLKSVDCCRVFFVAKMGHPPKGKSRGGSQEMNVKHLLRAIKFWIWRQRRSDFAFFNKTPILSLYNCFWWVYIGMKCWEWNLQGRCTL